MPYFEPRQISAPVEHTTARLPLIDEYDGFCQASEHSFPVPLICVSIAATTATRAERARIFPKTSCDRHFVMKW